MDAQRLAVALLRIVPVDKDSPAAHRKRYRRADIGCLCEKARQLPRVAVCAYLVVVDVGVCHSLPCDSYSSALQSYFAAVRCIRYGNTARCDCRSD